MYMYDVRLSYNSDVSHFLFTASDNRFTDSMTSSAHVLAMSMECRHVVMSLCSVVMATYLKDTMIILIHNGSYAVVIR